MQHVHTAAARQRVVAVAADQQVIAKPTVQHVGTVAAVECVVAAGADQRVVGCVAGGVEVGGALQGDLFQLRADQAVVDVTLNGICAFTDVFDNRVAEVAHHIRVVAGATCHGVVAQAAVQGVVACAAVERVAHGVDRGNLAAAQVVERNVAERGIAGALPFDAGACVATTFPELAQQRHFACLQVSRQTDHR